MSALAGWVVAIAAGLAVAAVKLARWRQRRAEARAAAAAELAADRGAELQVQHTARHDAAAAAAGGQEVTDAQAPRSTDPVDPVAAAQARTARGEEAARLVRARIAADRARRVRPGS